MAEIDYGVDVCLSARLSGKLYKWTNYITGWQERYFELDAGVFVYYKTQSDKNFGCRGSITIGTANVTENEIDQCRFDVAGKDAVWYLRAGDFESKTKWIRALKHYTFDSGYSTQTDGVSDVSVSSGEIAGEDLLRIHRRSASSPQDSDFAIKLTELSTCRDILLKQLTAVQLAIDQHRSADILQTESLKFRMTADAVTERLDSCIDTLVRREKLLQNSLEKEITKNRQLTERLYKVEQQQSSSLNMNTSQLSFSRASSPDPSTMLSNTSDDECWHDAAQSPPPIAQNDARNSTLNSRKQSLSSTSLDSIGDPAVAISPSHSLFNEVERITMEQLHYAKAGVEQGVWQLFSAEGEMKMYKREVEIDGLVCDPLKAVHSVKGVSAREYIHYFFDPQYKSQWDDTLVEMRTVEQISPDTVVLQQLHKRIWPTAQRESLFWSHTRKVNSHKDPNAHDLYMVCNKDCERPDTPLWVKGAVRVGLTIAMVCQTVIDRKPKGELTRDNVTCNIIYVAQVNPGGWVPSAGLRVVYKREYPRFLRSFTQYVQDQVKNKPLLL